MSGEHEQFRNYDLLEELGRGGMGVVYKARQHGLDRYVALKKILNLEGVSPTIVERFRSEAKAAAKLDHPGIVGIHEIGEHEGQPYFTMDFISGRTLAEAISSTPFACFTAARICLDIARAISYAHSNGVLHRDLKPSNIILDDEGHPRVTDFGLAKRLGYDSNLTQSGMILGTPGYMPPEQALGLQAEIGPQSDVYGVGAVLYAALTGRAPVKTDNVYDAVRRIVEDCPRPPSEIVPQVDRDVEAICLKCLEKNIQDRYGSAAELADDLERYLVGAGIVARPRNIQRKFWHWMHQPHRVSEAALIILLFAGFFGMTTVAGLTTLLTGWLPAAEPSKAAFIVVLDSMGFLLCLAVGCGIANRSRMSMWAGLLGGMAITSIVFVLILFSHKAGGWLDDPMFRFATYSIFGFVGFVKVLTSYVALAAHSAVSNKLIGEDTNIRNTGSTDGDAAFVSTLHFRRTS